MPKPSTAKIGHNSGDEMLDLPPDSEGAVAADQLRLFIERIERLNEEKKGTADDIKDVFSEAKATGFDTKTMRSIIAIRAMDTAVYQEKQAILETYKAALGIE